jgi:RNA polymerase sigma-70 factor (ECF subfamily)
VFLGFHRALARFRGEAAPRTLLHRITVNVAIDHLRRRGRRPVAALDAAALEELVGADDGPEERARRAQRLARVFEALATISPKKRVALLLRVVDELSFEEIGAIVGAKAEAAKKRAQHGLRELIARLGGDPDEEDVP